MGAALGSRVKQGILNVVVISSYIHICVHGAHGGITLAKAACGLHLQHGAKSCQITRRKLSGPNSAHLTVFRSRSRS